MRASMETLRTLRQKSQAGLEDCRRALEASQGDIEGAVALLKEWGFAELARRAERATEEGRIFLAREGRAAALVELRCETDFTALSPAFAAAGADLAALALAGRGHLDEARAASRLADLGGIVKEGLRLGRTAYLEAVGDEVLEVYAHASGSLGALLRCRITRAVPGPAGTVAEATLATEAASLVHDLCLHVAAFAPVYLDEGSIPEDYRAAKATEFRAEVEEGEATRGKPEALRRSIAEGKLRKHLQGVTLASQAFLKDETRSVGAVLRAKAAEGGPRVEVVGFARLALTA